MQNNANEMAVFNTAIYVRLSKEDIVAAQSGRESNSITNQKQLILDFLKDKPEFNIVSIRIDDGYTGTNFDRPAFQRMLNDIKAGRINCVVVKDLSRFGREYINSGKYIHRLFPVLGVRLIAINDNIDTITRDESSEFSITLKNLMNDNYSRDISVKVRSQLQVKRKHGDFICPFAPYGYQKCEGNHNRIEPDPYAATVVQEIHCIMVKDLSRFGRNFLEMGNYLELILPLYGVRFISINDAFDSDDYLGVTGGLELALRNLINNMYSRDLSTKVRSAFRTRNLRGEYWGGNGFFGYQVHPHNKKRLIVDEQVRDIIVMIFESCVAGMTTSEIAQMLNDMGIPSPLEHKRRNGGFYNGVVKEETGIWLKGAVRKILTDERYTGKMITNTRETEEVGKPKMRSVPRDQWIIVPGTHEAIISEELFRTAQNALQGRIRNVNKNTAGNRANNLFVCGCCGRKLRKNPAKEPHLVCPKTDSIKGAECAGLFVNQAQIEQAVLQMLREQSRSFLEQHCLMQACIDKKLSSIQTELDANTNMTRRLQSRKAELYEQYRAGRISREKFADIQKTDSEKLARLSSRAEEIKRLLVEHYESRGNLAAGKRTADQIILLKDYDPEIIRNFVERVRVYPSGEIEIDMRTSSGFEFVTAS